MTDARALHMANTFGCKVGSMPFTYLGIPLGTTKPTLQEFSPLTRIERRLGGISKFLSSNGRPLMVNCYLHCLPSICALSKFPHK
jgi:hypothetical protein